MKILLYFEGEKILAKSGIGRALDHQKRALSEVGIEYTLDADCSDYDILHINTYGVNSHRMVRKARKLGKKVIYHAHSTEEDFRNSFIGSNQLAPLVKKYLISLYSKADHLITPTPYSKTLLEGYGIKVPISAISNGIDLSRFYPSEEKEALASQQQVLVRDIPVYQGWLVANENCYMGHSIEEFKKYIEGLLEGKIPSTREAGYQVAEQRSIKQIGYELKEVYETVLS